MQASKTPGQHAPLVAMQRTAGNRAVVEQLSAGSTPGGQSLPTGTRWLMESRFQEDFSQVRIHANEDAAVLAASQRAKAYTVGRDIFFSKGRYAPQTGEGQKLIAHELAHVVQQSRAGDTFATSEAAESDAHSAASRVILGQAATVAARAPVGIQCEPEDEEKKPASAPGPIDPGLLGPNFVKSKTAVESLGLKKNKVKGPVPGMPYVLFNPQAEAGRVPMRSLVQGTDAYLIKTGVFYHQVWAQQSGKPTDSLYWGWINPNLLMADPIPAENSATHPKDPTAGLSAALRAGLAQLPQPKGLSPEVPGALQVQKIMADQGILKKPTEPQTSPQTPPPAAKPAKSDSKKLAGSGTWSDQFTAGFISGIASDEELKKDLRELETQLSTTEGKAKFGVGLVAGLTAGALASIGDLGYVPFKIYIEARLAAEHLTEDEIRKKYEEYKAALKQLAAQAPELLLIIAENATEMGKAAGQIASEKFRKEILLEEGLPTLTEQMTKGLNPKNPYDMSGLSLPALTDISQSLLTIGEKGDQHKHVYNKGVAMGQAAGYAVMEIVQLFVGIEEVKAAIGSAKAFKAIKETELAKKISALIDTIPLLKRLKTAKLEVESAEKAAKALGKGGTALEEVVASGKKVASDAAPVGEEAIQAGKQAKKSLTFADLEQAPRAFQPGALPANEVLPPGVTPLRRPQPAPPIAVAAGQDFISPVSSAGATSLEGEQVLGAATRRSGGAPAPRTPVATPPLGNGLPGFRTEPTLHNAGWGSRPSGGEKGEKYVRQITGRKDSLYVGDLKKELGGTGVVELDGYRKSDRFLLDAKDATVGGMYDVRGKDKFTKNVKIPKIIQEAIRQGHAMAKSGAAGIEWSFANKDVAEGVRKLFAQRGIAIRVVWQAKK